MLAEIVILLPGYPVAAASGLFRNGVTSLPLLSLLLASIGAAFWFVFFLPWMAGWQGLRGRIAARRS